MFSSRPGEGGAGMSAGRGLAAPLQPARAWPGEGGPRVTTSKERARRRGAGTIAAGAGGVRGWRLGEKGLRPRVGLLVLWLPRPSAPGHERSGLGKGVKRRVSGEKSRSSDVGGELCPRGFRKSWRLLFFLLSLFSCLYMKEGRFCVSLLMAETHSVLSQVALQRVRR